MPEDFVRDFRFVIRQSGCTTDDEFGRAIGLGRSTINRLRNGARRPTAKQAHLIAQYCGMDIDDLFLDHDIFYDIYLANKLDSKYMIHALTTINSNITRCRDLFPKYAGRWIVYTNRSERGTVVASLLEIRRVTKHGIEFMMINPYKEDGKYDAYVYNGYMMPVDEFLYFVADQENNTYEILTMLFHASGAPTPRVLQGLWTGIGVHDGAKCIASVTAVAIRMREQSTEWNTLVGDEIGYIDVSTLSEMVRRKLQSGIVKVVS